MADINISVAAIDEASEVLKEVRDNIQLVATETEQAAASVENSSSSFQVSLGGLAKAAAAAVTAYAGFVSIRSILGFMGDATDAFSVQTEALEGLKAAMDPLVPNAKAAAQAHAEFAAQLQAVTAVGDEVTLGLQKRAYLLGVEESQLDSVAAAAIGVAEATGLGLNEALRKVNDTINGNTGALGEYLPALKETEDAEEQLRLVSELAANGLEQKQESLDRLAGSQEAAQGAMGDLMETIGQALAPFEILINQGVQVFAETLNSLLIPSVEGANSAFQAMGEWKDWLVEKAVAVAVGFSVVWDNVGQIVQLAGVTLELTMIQMVGAIEHALTVQAPAYAIWFADNFVNIIVDMGSAVATAITNIGKNIGELAFAIFNFVSSGFEGGMEGFSQKLSNAVFVGVMDGFEPTTQALPEIAKRQISAYEQSLINEGSKLTFNLADDFRKKFDLQMDRIRGMQADIPEIDVDLSATVDQGLKDSMAANSQALQAVEGRLLTRGRAEDPTETVAENTTKMVGEQKKTNDRVDQLAKAIERNNPEIAITEVATL
jgi:hypothetical protein